jgi:hypothetical protein
VPRGLALSDSKKAEFLASILEAQFQQVNGLLDSAVIDVVGEAIH